MVDTALLDDLKRYVGFGPDDEAALRDLVPLVMPHSRAIAEEFYERASRDPGASQVFSGPEQVQRLKRTLSDWLATLLSGPWDEEYFERRSRIGHVHVQHALPQRYMVAAMNVVRVAIANLLERHLAEDAARLARALEAVAKILDIDLALMLETYRSASLNRARGDGGLHTAIVDRGRALVFAADADERLVLFNDACEAVTGHRRDTVLGEAWSRALGLSTSGAELVRAAAAAARAGRVPAPVTVSLSSAGGNARMVRWQIGALGTDGGAGFHATGVDVTDERSLAAQVRKSERVAALGTMAAGLAHEIRNPLNAAHLQIVLVSRHLARLPGEDNAAARESVAIAARELQRLSSTVDTFMRFARPQPLALARADLRRLTEAAVAQARPAVEAAGVVLEVTRGAPVLAEIDAERMSHAITHLVHNAAEAAAEGGMVRVGVDATAAGPMVEIADDGPGLPDGARLFEPFFSTKERGAGLGLATVQRIVHDHGGRIEVERRSGWTVFAIVLPG